MLIAPGRLGTSSCELGVPVTFADINNFTVVYALHLTLKRDPAFVTQMIQIYQQRRVHSSYLLS